MVARVLRRLSAKIAQEWHRMRDSKAGGGDEGGGAPREIALMAVKGRLTGESKMAIAVSGGEERD